MSLALLILGLLAVAAGGGMLAFGVPIHEFGLGNTLIVSGVTAIAAGLVVIGLAAAVSQLRRIAESLTTRPVPRALRPGDPLEPLSDGARPAPRLPVQRRPSIAEASNMDRRVNDPHVAAPAVDVSAEAIERLRSTFPRIDRGAADAPAPAVERDEDVPLSPRAPTPKVPPPAVRPTPADTRTEPRREPPQSAAEEAGEKPRSEFLWRSKARAEAAAPKENFDTLWPPSKQPAPTSDAPAIQPNGDKATAPAAPPSASGQEQPAPVAILKSGVVDGMAYTLYADGSIEAKLPEGTVRFGSISELRAHLEAHENQT